MSFKSILKAGKAVTHAATASSDNSGAPVFLYVFLMVIGFVAVVILVSFMMRKS